MRHLVVNADDFGFDAAIDAAVEQAHVSGILTSASLMVSGPHVEAAVECAKRHPKLGVGIHLCLIRGRASSEPGAIKGLAANDGSLPGSLLRLSARLTFDGRLENAVATELRTQVERFLAMGLRPTHLDSHMHTHLHPRVLGIVMRLAHEYGIPFVRAPVEPLWTALRCGRHHLARRIARWTVFSTLGNRARRLLRQQGLRTVDRAIGVLDPGHLNEGFLLAYLGVMPEGLTEIFFHPATEATEALRQCQHAYEHGEECRALCSSRVREVIERRGIELTSFRELADAVG